MDSWIAQIHCIFWGFSLPRLTKKGYYFVYSILIMQTRTPGEGDLEHSSCQTLWQDFQIKIFPFLTFYFLFEIFHGRNFPTNSDHKYISMILLQYPDTVLYLNSKSKSGMCFNLAQNKWEWNFKPNSYIKKC